MKTRSLTFVLLAACAADTGAPSPETVSLVDPCTHEQIGIKDLHTGAYYSDDGSEYGADQVYAADLPDDLCAARVVPGGKKKTYELMGTMASGYCTDTMCLEDSGMSVMSASSDKRKQSLYFPESD